MDNMFISVVKMLIDLRNYLIKSDIMIGGPDNYLTPMHEIIAPTLGKGGLYLGNIHAVNNHT